MGRWKWLTAAVLTLALAAVCALSLPYWGRAVPRDDLPPLVTVPGKTRAPAEEPIDLNTADLTLLMTLPDIGQTRAAAIIAYRQTHGPFRSVEGIGPGVLELVREEVCITPHPDSTP